MASYGFKLDLVLASSSDDQTLSRFYLAVSADSEPQYAWEGPNPDTDPQWHYLMLDVGIALATDPLLWAGPPAMNVDESAIYIGSHQRGVRVSEGVGSNTSGNV